MGTDDTIVGWKEDFNMSYQHQYPHRYKQFLILMKLPHRQKRRYELADIPKGGNLAVYGAARCKSKFKKRIINIYNNDGPGFDEAFIKR